jgi:ribosomal protein S18 acetylase RimI-like enzyme
MKALQATDSIVIRSALPSDAEAIHAALIGIGETVGEVHKIKSTPADLRRDGFGPNAHFHTLIAEIDSRFAGMCLYFPIYSTWMGRPGAYVQDLFVAEKFRGLKIGERLLRTLARTVRDQGGAYIELAVDTGNFAAQRFYERVGITHRSDDHIHRITGEAFFAFAEADFPEDA